MFGYKKFRPKILPEVITTFTKPPATVKYPGEKVEMPKNYRGKIAFDANLCIGCKMCMRDCPAQAIKIEPAGAEKKFKATFALDRCIYCAQCVDSCPRKALSSTKQFELACYQRDDCKDIQE